MFEKFKFEKIMFDKNQIRLIIKSSSYTIDNIKLLIYNTILPLKNDNSNIINYAEKSTEDHQMSDIKQKYLHLSRQQ